MISLFEAAKLTTFSYSGNSPRFAIHHSSLVIYHSSHANPVSSHANPVPPVMAGGRDELTRTLSLKGGLDFVIVRCRKSREPCQ